MKLGGQYHWNLQYVDENKFSLIKLLTPIVSNYGFEEIKLLIIDDIKRKWQSLNDDNKCLKFLKDFWFYLPTESLLFINNLLPKGNAFDLDKLSFEIYNSNHIESYQDDIIEILLNFQQFSDRFILSLDLLMKYGLSGQLHFTKLLKAFTQSFTYERYDHNLKYTTQIKLLDYLYQKVQEENKIFYSKTILFIAHKYLVDSYQSNYSDGSKMYIGQIPVNLSLEQKEFRIKLWNFIFDCYKDEHLKEFVLDFFEQHRYEHHYLQYDVVIKFDKKLVIDFCVNNFLPNPNFRETKIFYRFLKNLSFYNVKYDKRLKGKFRNDEVDLWYLLNERALDKRELLYQYINGFSIKEYEKLLQQIHTISTYKKDYFRGYSTIKESISYIFIKLAKTDFKLFLEVFELLFKYDYSNYLFLGMIFKDIEYNEVNSKELRNLILENKIATGCIVSFLSHLPIAFITFQDYEILMTFFRDEKNVWINFIEDIFLKFKNLEIDFDKELNSVIDELIKKSGDVNFYVHNDFFKYIYEDHNHIFVNRLENIQSLYLTLDEKDKHFDYNLEVLKLILKINPKFIKDLLKSTFDEKTYISRNDFLENDFKKLWSLDNRNEIFEDIIRFSSKFPSVFKNVRSEVSTAFQGSGENGINFLYYIVNKTTDERVLKLTFNIVVSVFNESKYDFLNIILKKNSKIEFFRRLDFYAGSSVTVNSRIPKIREEITIYEELRDFLQKLNNIDYLEHLSFIENQINGYKAEIEWERKRDFLSEWSI